MSGRGAIAALLEREGFGHVAQNIWVGRQPSGTPYPNVVINLYDGAVIETFAAAEQQPFMQVFITGEVDADEENEAMADGIWNTLARVGSFTLDGTAINMVRPTTVPLDLGSDGNGRPMRSINIEVTYE